jgi:serine/threonine protein kinase
MAPEILIAGSYNKRSDLWSIGMVLFEFLFGYHPFKKMKNFADLVAYVKEGVSVTVPPITRPKNVDPSPDCIDLLQQLLQPDPHNRITWEAFFHHPWLSSSNQAPPIKLVSNDKNDNKSVNADQKSPLNETTDHSKNEKGGTQGGVINIPNDHRSSSRVPSSTNSASLMTQRIVKESLGSSRRKKNNAQTDSKSPSLNPTEIGSCPSPLILPESPFNGLTGLSDGLDEGSEFSDDSGMEENTYDSIGSSQDLEDSIEVKKDIASIKKKVDEFAKMVVLEESHSAQKQVPDKEQIDFRFAKISPEVYTRKSVIKKAYKKFSDRDEERLKQSFIHLMNESKLNIIRPLTDSADSNESDSEEPNFLEVKINDGVNSPDIGSMSNDHLIASDPGKKKESRFCLDDAIRRSYVVEKRRSVAKVCVLDMLDQTTVPVGGGNIRQPRYQTLPLQLPSNGEAFHVSLGQSRVQLHYSN